jgi:RHS repeat-associated protein
MEYNEFNQLVRWNGIDVIYDLSGNMIYGPLGGAMVEFEYDARNRLIRAGDTHYEYDAENNRTAVIADGVRTELVTCTVLSLCRILTATTDDVATYYVWGFGLISQVSEDNWLYFHFNNIGSTQAVTDSDGDVVERFSYCPYGNLTSANERGIMFLYNGMFGIVTDSNGLLHMRARFYNPEIMRFINVDPIKDGWSWYAYAAGNPVSLFDPFGLAADCPQGVNWDGDSHWFLDIIDIYRDFYNPNTYTVSDSFEWGIFRGNGSATMGYSEAMWRGQSNTGTSTKGWIGGFGKVSFFNLGGRVGVGNDDLSLSRRTVLDVFTVTGQAGIAYMDGVGVGVSARASLVAIRETAEINIFGWEIEAGGSAHFGSIGGHAIAGYFPEDGFRFEFGKSKLLGADVLFRVKPNQEHIDIAVDWWADLFR